MKADGRRTITALGVAGVAQALLLLLRRTWIFSILDTTLASLAMAAGQVRSGGGVLMHALWLALVPLACGALAARLAGQALNRRRLLILAGAVCGAASLVVDRQPGAALFSVAAGGMGTWLAADALSRGRSGRLDRWLRWVAGVLARTW